MRGKRADTPAKPDPTGTNAILSRLGVPAPRVALVGDSEVDIETAIAAGCASVGVTWGFRRAVDVVAAAPDHVCYSVDELRAVLGLALKEEETV